MNLAMPRLHRRAPKGERVRAAVPQHYGQNVTTLGALSLQGTEAAMSVEGAADA